MPEISGSTGSERVNCMIHNNSSVYNINIKSLEVSYLSQIFGYIDKNHAHSDAYNYTSDIIRLTLQPQMQLGHYHLF